MGGHDEKVPFERNMEPDSSNSAKTKTNEASDLSDKTQEHIPKKMKTEDQSIKPPAVVAPEAPKCRQIHVSGLPPNMNEKLLYDHFKRFGPIQNINIIRDKTTGISRGFGFVTFLTECDAESALNMPQHMLDGRHLRVAYAVSVGEKAKFAKNTKDQWLDLAEFPKDQTQMYVGPLDDRTSQADLQAQFVQFGAIRDVCVFRSYQTTVKKSFGYVNFVDPKSLMRAFGSKTTIHGKAVIVALSRFSMEVVLSDSVIFFYEAHVFVEDKELDCYFSKFGQVYRALHLSDSITVRDSTGLGVVSRSYGFVDFVSEDSARECFAQKTHLIPPQPGQYVRVGQHLPHVLKYDLLSISESDSSRFLRRLEKNTPTEGEWGACQSAGSISNKVRLLSSLIPKLIGEGGKKIAEICRDTKTKITIAPIKPEMTNALITVTGTREDVMAAMYVMQKTIKLLKES